MAGWELDRRSGLLKAAAVFYSGILAVTALLIAVSGVDLEPQLSLRGRDLLIGIAAVVPMLPIFVIAIDLRDLVSDLLGRPLSECRLPELAFLAAMAGFTEEVFFRGLLQEWWGPNHFWIGLVAVNLLFGALHALTPVYFLIAAGVGFYFSFLAELTEPRSLVIPITAHALYDFIGFLLIGRDYRREHAGAHEAPPPDSAPPPPSNPGPDA